MSILAEKKIVQKRVHSQEVGGVLDAAFSLETECRYSNIRVKLSSLSSVCPETYFVRPKNLQIY